VLAGNRAFAIRTRTLPLRINPLNAGAIADTSSTGNLSLSPSLAFSDVCF
jgi:hypothetical protein